MNIFKKALIVALSIGLISVPTVTKEVEAATTYYFKPGVWNVDGAVFYAWTWGKTDAWAKATDSDGDGVFEFTMPNDNTNLLFTRQKNGTTNPNWSNVWNQTSDTSIPTNGNNCLSITGWENGDFKWEKYTVPTVNYTVSYYDDSTLLTSEEVGEKSNLKIDKFFEKEGYRFEGWYLDSGLTTKATGEESVTSDISIYAKYVEAEDYRVYFNTTSLLGGDKIYVYSFLSVDKSSNAEWPGVEASKDETSGLWYYDIDASKSWDYIIFNGGKDKQQTIDLSLSYENTIYTIGEKDGEKYTASSTLLDTVTAQLGVNYTYNSETNKLNEVTSASLRFATNEITKPTYTVTSYGMTIAFGGAAKDVVWTSEEIVEKEGKISWSGVVTNIPTSYFNVKVTVECFVMIGETKVVVSNSREVTIVSLANTYIEEHSEELEPVQKAACQYIVDSVAA